MPITCIASLSESHLPQKYQHIVQFQDVIDRAYCFFTKNHIRCAIASLHSMYNQLVLVTELHNHSQWKEFSLDKLKLLCSFCPMEFLISTSGDVSIFTYKQYPGVGKSQISYRKKLLLAALWERIDKYLEARGFNISSADIAKIKKQGWPEEFQIEDCQYPFEALPYSNHVIHAQIITGQKLEISNKISTENSPSSAPEDEETAQFKPEENVHQSTQYAHILDYLKKSKFYKDQIKYIHTVPAKDAVFVSMEPPLSSFITRRLKELHDIQSLYRHQALGIQAIRRGKHTMITTSTASGKSFIYNIPVIETIQQDPEAIAIYLFPTKALAQDQYRAINDFLNAPAKYPTTGTVPSIPYDHNVVPVVCDGDTSLGDRLSIRQGVGNIILTNPDMLHYTLLPEHKAWSRIFKKLKYIVIDEAHIYSGVFGCHVANVFRRLLRICLFYNDATNFVVSSMKRSISLPQFICCSATMNQPLEQLKRLIPLDILSLIQHSQQESVLAKEPIWEIIGTNMDGAPHGEKTFIIWNPFNEWNDANLQSKSVPESDTKVELADSSIARELVLPISASKQESKKKPKNRSTKDEGSLDVIAAMNDSSSSTTLQSLKNDRAEQDTSILIETAQLISRLMQFPPEDHSPYRIIAFCRTRKLVELIYKYTSTYLESGTSNGKELASKLVSYRGGYHKDERRVIESQLFQHQLLGVIATCALELGIDVGSLDISVHLGFPGSLASLWQQMGRVGRNANRKQSTEKDSSSQTAAKSGGSLSILICFNCPIDQYFCKYPEILFQTSSTPQQDSTTNSVNESSQTIHTQVDHSNLFILKSHLTCAAQELPLNTLFYLDKIISEEPGLQPTVPSSTRQRQGFYLDHVLWGNQQTYEEAIEVLFEGYKLRPLHMNQYLAFKTQEQKVLIPAADKWLKTVWSYWPQGITTSSSTQPAGNSSSSYSKQEAARSVNLRLIDPLTINVINDTNGQIIDCIEYSRAFFELYAGAILLQQGQQYLITRLDLTNTTAHATPVKEPYYTSALNTTMVNIMKIIESDDDDNILSVSANPVEDMQLQESTKSPYESPKKSRDNQVDEITTPNNSKSMSEYKKDRKRKAPGNSNEVPTTLKKHPDADETNNNKAHIVHYGIVQVVMKVYGYRKIRLGSGQTFETGECSLPPLEYETQGFWIDIPSALIHQMHSNEWTLRCGIHAINHVLLTASALLSTGYTMKQTISCCSGIDMDFQQTDLACEHSLSPDIVRTTPLRIMLYDKNPGGLGICGNLFVSRYSLFSVAYQLIQDCSCSYGCPSCILDSRCTAYNNYVDKAAAKEILAYFMGVMKPSQSNSTPNGSDNNQFIHAQECHSSDTLMIAANQGEEIFFITPSEVAASNQEWTPRKKKRQQSVKQAAAKRSSDRARKSILQSSWIKSMPDFITESPDTE